MIRYLTTVFLYLLWKHSKRLIIWLFSARAENLNSVKQVGKIDIMQRSTFVAEFAILSQERFLCSTFQATFLGLLKQKKTRTTFKFVNKYAATKKLILNLLSQQVSIDFCSSCYGIFLADQLSTVKVWNVISV